VGAAFKVVDEGLVGVACMPAAETTIELIERQPRRFSREELSVDMARAIDRTGKLQVDAHPFDPDFPFTVTSKDVVGYVPVGNKVVVCIQPKTPIANLFRMLEVAYDLKSFRLLPGMVDVHQLEDVYERLALVLASRVLMRVRKGVFRDYIEQVADLTCIRGRLLVRQLAKHVQCGSARAPCEYQEHTADLKDNQILLWTLWLLSAVPISRHDVRARIRGAYRALVHGVSLVPVTPDQCLNRRYHRLNEDYEPLHALCRFFLEHAGPGLEQGERRMIPFIVDMPKLFERFVALWMQTNSPEFEVRPQYVARLDASEKLSFNIDLVVNNLVSGAALAVLDTKYKLDELPSESDVQQVVAYAVRMGVTKALLVYPSRRPENFRAKIGPISVEAVGFDLAADYVEEGQRFRSTLLSKIPAT
jgi:5-methylcytosine-specific restriction enzyme subunit McrC